MGISDLVPDINSNDMRSIIEPFPFMSVVDGSCDCCKHAEGKTNATNENGMAGGGMPLVDMGIMSNSGWRTSVVK
jgi:hypothetical protein